MRKVFCLIPVFMMMASCLCFNVNAAALNGEPVVSSADIIVFDIAEIARATGSFTVSIPAYKRSEAAHPIPLKKGDTATIIAEYTPVDASMDFGLIDEDGIFHCCDRR